MPAVLNSKLINEVVKSFPNLGKWKQIRCKSLRDPRYKASNKRSWAILDELKGNGGVYAFLLPQNLFKRAHEISLHGPNKRIIQFGFSVGETQLVGEGQYVSYVGRASNLLTRVQWHFYLHEKSTTSQMRKGLVNCGLCKDGEAAISLILDHATIAWHVLDGDANVANRDIIEVSLWGKFMPPFNIKSEH